MAMGEGEGGRRISAKGVPPGRQAKTCDGREGGDAQFTVQGDGTGPLRSPDGRKTRGPSNGQGGTAAAWNSRRKRAG